MEGRDYAPSRPVWEHDQAHSQAIERLREADSFVLFTIASKPTDSDVGRKLVVHRLASVGGFRVSQDLQLRIIREILLAAREEVSEMLDEIEQELLESS